MEISLSQSEADTLLASSKVLVRKVTGLLTDGDTGSIPIMSNSDSRKFILAYFYSLNNMHLQFYDEKTKLTLVRLNLNDSFHKNADGTIVTGNRVNLFSEQEFYDKNDGNTHTRAFPLPHGILTDTNDFLVALANLLNYTHTATDNLSLSIANDLNL
jgi:hypothetical protein